nr:ATP-binding protein [Pseudoruegeria sp. HB172150]
MRTIVETSQDAIVVANARGLILEFNPAAEQTFGLSREQTLGEKLIDTLLPEHMREKAQQDYFRFLRDGSRPTAGARQFEVTAVDSSGREFPAEVSVDQAEDAGGRVFVAYIRDISRRRAAEDNLTEARDRALAGERSKAEFLAVMSHEMRTPLNGLLGSMQLMQDEPMSDRQQELLNRMQFSGRLLLSLVNDVLDLAKYEAGKMEVVRKAYSIPQLLDGVVETTAPLAAKNGNTLEWRWVGDPSEGAVGDPRRLRQVLLNLVGNAVKFTRAGSVEIEVELIGSASPQIEFRVIDSGIGIAEQDLDRIFRDFETLDSSYARQAGGTGLGLGIARRFAKLMGGETGVESVRGEGSLFWLRLPFERAVFPLATPRARVENTAISQVSPLDVLLVEDNEINRLVAREILEADGHTVTEAVNGRAGVEWAAAKQFDVILMDVSMPVMDGPEAARNIRAGDGASAKTPIVAITAHALPEEIAGFREAGMSHCISKPLDRETLRQTLAVVAGETEQSDIPAPKDSVRRCESALLSTENLERFVTKGSTALLDRSIAEITWDIDRIGGGLQNDELRRAVHKCAGTCGVFGFSALRDALAAIETKLKRGGAIESRDLREVADLWEETRTALLEWSSER